MFRNHEYQKSSASYLGSRIMRSKESTWIQRYTRQIHNLSRLLGGLDIRRPCWKFPETEQRYMSEDGNSTYFWYQTDCCRGCSSTKSSAIWQSYWVPEVSHRCLRHLHQCCIPASQVLPYGGMLQMLTKGKKNAWTYMWTKLRMQISSPR